MESEFVPGELVVQFDDRSPAATRADGLTLRAAGLGLVPLAGAVRGRPALLGLGATAAARAAALSSVGAAPGPAGSFGMGRGPAAAAKHETLRAIKALRRRPNIRTAEPNYIVHTAAVPDDTFYPYQWHYPLINLPQAWDVTTGTPEVGTSVIVAVIDTGVFLAHPDMTGQLVVGYDFISSPAMARDGDGIDADPDDPGDAATPGSSSWHGTHVAGTVAARSDDGVGVAGTSWGARIMPVRVLGVGGGTSYDVIQGIRFAAGLSNDSSQLPLHRADIANMSLGCQNCFSQAAQDAIDAAVAAGMIVVAAAGNANSTEPSYPAAYDGVVSVSAVDMHGERAPYSNRGPSVDIAGPGGNTAVDSDGNGYPDGVLSALVDDSSGTRQPAWAFYQGTSMAAPHVAGVIALMQAVCRSLTPLQVDEIIASGAMTTDLGAGGRDDTYGHGLVDALGAVQAAETQCGITPAPGLDVSPGRLDFGAQATSFTLTASKRGQGDLSVTGVSDDASWLTVTAASVNAQGLGAYTASVNRNALADGRYSASITFTATGGAQVVIPISTEVGSSSTAGDVGYLYVQLLDSNRDAVAEVQGRSVDGSLAFEFTGIAPGQYLIVAGTDSDNDGLVCDAGESCGAWPTLGAPTALSVGPNSVTGLDFIAGFALTLGP